ncbi:hypothetical protein GETHPA_16860 [Geothrix rubra]|uniref:Ada DNA repair metal-binding domain-containing protein n=1 Tax=Geothrix rubra TaxID=2927977 RepID=A0ABQ5Q6P4_9BACT|nr:Ada metal-binding domain-containing protein [Geothrix rubra]GLH70153.1 hypothetical protein GETHPA_16860 [Geothrix rubra]
MKRLLFTLFLASSVLAVAQAPAAPPQTKAEKKAAKKAEKKAAQEAKAAPATAAKPAPATRPAPAAKAVPSASAIVANKDSKTFHRADCTFVAKMKPANRVAFANAAEAARAGYKPCKVCKPE